MPIELPEIKKQQKMQKGMWLNLVKAQQNKGILPSFEDVEKDNEDFVEKVKEALEKDIDILKNKAKKT